MRIYMNDNWFFTPDFKEDFANGGGEEIRIPHTTAFISYNYPDIQSYQKTSGYRRIFFAAPSLQGKRIQLTFEGAAHIATVFLNGKELTTHFGGYTAFTVDISEELVYGAENTLVVRLDSRESCNVPPFGFVIDYLAYGGIYRDVYLDIKNPCCFGDVFVHTDSLTSFCAELEVFLPEEMEEIRFSLVSSAKEIICTGKTEKRGTRVILADKNLKVQPWDTERPNLYELVLELYSRQGLTDTRTVRFGFRTAQFTADGFYLNGQKLKLRGLNRHQSFPYAGYAMPKSMQEHDAVLLKEEYGVNACRTSHYPQSHYFLDKCDELGILVFTEIPGWQHIGDDVWKQTAKNNVREMVLQYRNHPSIILWGVRINESQDDDVFYEQTNAIAHRLDPTRQTSGVRFLEKSHFLEDVYAFNDFSHTGANAGLKPPEKISPDSSRGYLVSEYNGHMFPTKAFDDEAHRLNHALRHANVLESMYRQEKISGCFGWCMFDYNTHKDFGSGDGICYHGAGDMFRNKKLAAYVYESQSDRTPVLEISSSMNIGEYPAGNIGEVWMFTNADSVRFYRGEGFVKEFFPDRSPKGRYAHMPHPPVLLDDTVGVLLESREGFSHKKAEAVKDCLFAVQKYSQNNLPLKYKLKFLWCMARYRMSFEEGYRLYTQYIGNWGGESGSYRFDAVKDGKVIKSVLKSSSFQIAISAVPSHTELTEEHSYDVAEIHLKATDEHGNTAFYFQEPYRVECSENLEVIGGNLFSFKGGMSGIYVKTKGVAGSAEVTIECLAQRISVHFEITMNNQEEPL